MGWKFKPFPGSTCGFKLGGDGADGGMFKPDGSFEVNFNLTG